MFPDTILQSSDQKHEPGDAAKVCQVILSKVFLNVILHNEATSKGCSILCNESTSKDYKVNIKHIYIVVHLCNSMQSLIESN